MFISLWCRFPYVDHCLSTWPTDDRRCLLPRAIFQSKIMRSNRHITTITSNPATIKIKMTTYPHQPMHRNSQNAPAALSRFLAFWNGYQKLQFDKTGYVRPRATCAKRKVARRSIENPMRWGDKAFSSPRHSHPSRVIGQPNQEHAQSERLRINPLEGKSTLLSLISVNWPPRRLISPRARSWNMRVCARRDF